MEGDGVKECRNCEEEGGGGGLSMEREESMDDEGFYR